MYSKFGNNRRRICFSVLIVIGLLFSSLHAQAEVIFYSVAAYKVEEGAVIAETPETTGTVTNVSGMAYFGTGSTISVGSLTLELNGDTYAWTQPLRASGDDQQPKNEKLDLDPKAEIVGNLGSRIHWITEKNQAGVTGEPISITVFDKTPITYFEPTNSSDNDRFVMKKFEHNSETDIPSLTLTIQSPTDHKSETLELQIRAETHTYEHMSLHNTTLLAGPPRFIKKESVDTQEVVDGEWGCFVLNSTEETGGTYLILVKAEISPRKSKQDQVSDEEQYVFESKVMRVKGKLASPRIYERTLEMPKNYRMIEGGATIFDPALPSPRNKGVMPSLDRFTTWSARESDPQNFYGLESIESIDLLSGPRITSIVDRPKGIFKVLLSYNNGSQRLDFYGSGIDVLTRMNALSPNNNNSPFESTSPDDLEGVAAIVDVGHMVVPYYLSKRWLFPGRAELLKSVGMVQAVDVHSTSNHNVYTLDYFFEQRVAKVDLPKHLIGIIAAENSVHYTDFKYKLHVKDGEEFAFVYSISETEHIFIFNTFNLVDPLNQ